MKLKTRRTLIRLKKKYLVGTQHKSIKRRKGDDQPGKVVRNSPTSSKTHIIPNNGRRHRFPTGLPGTPQGRKEQGRRNA